MGGIYVYLSGDCEHDRASILAETVYYHPDCGGVGIYVFGADWEGFGGFVPLSYPRFFIVFQ